ncbi:hypothetical protein ES703_30647 [subsurface metagenome]
MISVVLLLFIFGFPVFFAFRKENETKGKKEDGGITMMDRKPVISHKLTQLLLDWGSKTKRVLFLMVLGIAFLLSSSMTSAPDIKASDIQSRERSASENVEFVGRWPYGTCEGSAVDTSRNIALIGNGYTLQVLDISNPTSISKIGEIELDGQVQDIAISGNYAYVLTRSYLVIIDISDLTSPQGISGFYFIGYDDLQSVAISSGCAYVAAGFSGLIIFDVSDPNNPGFLALHNQNAHYVHDVVIWGNYAICDCEYHWLDTDSAEWVYEEQVQVIDVSDPSAPLLTGTYKTEANYNLQGIDVSGDGYVYTSQYSETDETSKIVVIDVATDPASPAEVGSYIESESYFKGIMLSGNYAYILDSWWPSRLFALDISNPLLPSYAGECEANGDFYDIDISGNFVGISHGGDGFSLYDVSNPASPSQLGNYDTPYGVFWRHGTSIVVSGDYVYLEGLRIMDVSDPSNPFLAGVGGAGDASSIAISGRFAYCCGGWQRHFKIVDISSPTNPYQVASLGFPDGYQLFDVVVRGNYAYVSGNKGWGGNPYGILAVIDISNPMNPHIVGSYECPVISFNSGGIALSGDYAYLVVEDWSLYSDLSANLRIIDISDPTDPTEVGSYFSGRVETTTTDPDGMYSHSVLHGWTGTVIPSKDGYEFSPSHRRYPHVSSNMDEQDYTATEKHTNVPPQPRDFSPQSRYLFPKETKTTGNSRQDPPPTISGSVKTEGDIGIEGVTITFLDSYSYSSDVAVRGDYAYLAGGSLRIIDVSDSANPNEISSINRQGNQVALSGDYAYYGNLWVVDISDPFNPIDPVNSSPKAYYYGEGGVGVAVSGNYAYVTGSLTILKNLLAPEISIKNPSAWDTLYGSISIEALASHSLGIDRVEFYIDEELRSTDFTSPYSYAWNTAFEVEGPHRIRARAYNNIRDRSSDSEIEVTVRNQCNLSIFYSSGGITNPDTGTQPYDFGTEVPIIATPDNGYRFGGWTGDVPQGHENDNPLMITVDSDKSVTANFIKQCTLTLSAETGGTTDPVPGSHTYDVGTEVSLTAIPDSDYRFTGWTGDVPGGLENVVPLTITVDSDKLIAANFEAESPDEGGAGKKDWPCFIATAAYGSPLHPHIDVLRDFRDKYLMPSKLGRLLVECYYRYSPSVADFIAKHKALKVVVRASLLPLVAFSLSLLHLGPIMIAAMFLSVFGLPVFLVLVFRKRMR